MTRRVVGCVAATLLAAVMQAGNAAPLASAQVSLTSPLLPLYAPWPAAVSLTGNAAAIQTAIVGAQSGGVSGFIVDWRNDVQSIRRLRSLAVVAARLRFHLAVRYVAVGSGGGALPVDRIATDFESFSADFAANPVFSWLDGKAVLIWSGTTSYSRRSVAAATSRVRPGILVLATENTVAGYQRLSELTDGDAPASAVGGFASAPESARLRQLAAAVHAQGKYWVAPFGGPPESTAVVVSYGSAIQSSPDALEFTADGALPHALSELRFTATPDPPTATDSSDSAQIAVKGEQQYNLAVLVGFPVALAILVGLIVHQRRSRRRRSPPR